MSCRLVGGLLSHSLDYCFVLEDEDGICGYAVGTADVTPYLTKCKHSWIPFMQEKYTKPKADKELSAAEVLGPNLCATNVLSSVIVGLAHTLNGAGEPGYRYSANIGCVSM